jgi:hypothetical protein
MEQGCRTGTAEGGRWTPALMVVIHKSSLAENRDRVVIHMKNGEGSPHLPLFPPPSVGKPCVGAAATTNRPEARMGVVSQDSLSLPGLWTRAATNTIWETLIWSGFERGLIRCRRYADKNGSLSSALGQGDAVRPGMVPPHDHSSSAPRRRVTGVVAGASTCSRSLIQPRGSR